MFGQDVPQHADQPDTVSDRSCRASASRSSSLLACHAFDSTVHNLWTTLLTY
jgi:hypothetical protein